MIRIIHFMGWKETLTWAYYVGEWAWALRFSVSVVHGSPSAPPQLQENITTSVCVSVGGLWLRAFVFLQSEASVDFGSPSVFWLFLFLLESFDLLPRPELLCSCSSIWNTQLQLTLSRKGPEKGQQNFLIKRNKLYIKGNNLIYVKVTNYARSNFITISPGGVADRQQY